MNTKNLTIKQAMANKSIAFNDFYNALYEYGEGFWDGINSTEIIKMYITDMMNKDVYVSHILEAIEKKGRYNDTELWQIWLGNSMETPQPIKTKKDLVDALELNEEQLKTKLEFEI